MAIFYLGCWRARVGARFHVQVELSGLPSDLQTPAAIPVQGCVVRIFRGDSSLSIGDTLAFHVNVCRRDDRIPCGPAYMLYDEFLRARYLEIFLNGTPPRLEGLDECKIPPSPTRKPQIQASRLAYAVERLKWAFH